MLARTAFNYNPIHKKDINIDTIMMYTQSQDAGRACPSRPVNPGLDPVRIRPRGGGRMRLPEFLKYLIVMLLLAIVLVAVSR